MTGRGGNYPQGFLQQLKDEGRFEKAGDLLLRTSKPIKQVAEASGFRNEKSFIRAFREWIGNSPPGFRVSAHGSKCPFC
ncbi:helix-turn-helix domain-containing protein [Polaromonas sp. CF318]|uniref:helix-turn-helix domain-containing protein n=1 Tax=Polaromonas sp. CF318 TaxID=1144318 RepID=UPI00350F5CAD